MVVEEIFGVIQRLKEERRLTVLLVEQNAALALDIADHGYIMENGRIVLEGPAESLRQNSDIKEFYLGLNEAGARQILPRHQALPPAQALALLSCPVLGGRPSRLLRGACPRAARSADPGARNDRSGRLSLRGAKRRSNLGAIVAPCQELPHALPPRIAVIGTGGTISSLGASSLDVLDYPDFGRKLTSEALIDRFPENPARCRAGPGHLPPGRLDRDRPGRMA